MSGCANAESCRFFAETIVGMPALAEIYRQNYCETDFESCARYFLYTRLGPGNVPPDLWPNQMVEAQRYLEENGAA